MSNLSGFKGSKKFWNFFQTSPSSALACLWICYQNWFIFTNSAEWCWEIYGEWMNELSHSQKSDPIRHFTEKHTDSPFSDEVRIARMNQSKVGFNEVV